MRALLANQLSSRREESRMSQVGTPSPEFQVEIWSTGTQGASAAGSALTSYINTSGVTTQKYRE